MRSNRPSRLSKVPALPPEPADAETVSFGRAIRDGVAFVATHATARAVVLTLFVGVAFAAVDNVALVFLTRDELDAGPAAFGVVSSAFGFGMLAASLALTRWERLVSARTAFLGGWVLAYAVGGVLVDLMSTRAVFVAASAGVFAAAAAGALLLPRSTRSSATTVPM